MIEVLAGLLADGNIRWGVESWTDAAPSLPTQHGGAFIAIDVGKIISLQTFKDRMDAMIRDIRHTPAAKGSEGVCLPGEMEWRRRREALAGGIPLPDDVRASLHALAEEFSLKTDWL